MEKLQKEKKNDKKQQERVGKTHKVSRVKHGKFCYNKR